MPRGRDSIIIGDVCVLCVLAASIVCGLYFGDVKLTLGELFALLGAGPREVAEEAIKHNVIWRIRMPRVVAGVASGAVLASCGVVFQAVLRNPLAEPYTLGVASGAAFGASAAIFAGARWVTAWAFAGSISALAAVWALGWRRGESDASGIVLAGVITSSILGACMTLLKAMAGDKLGAIVVWLMGSLSAASWRDVLPMLLAFSLALLVSVSFSKELDIMASGMDGSHLGMNVPATRMTLLGGTSLAVSFVISRFGVIGFVGLVVPHLLRILFGPSHRHLAPLSILGGGALLCAADTAAKAMGELPVGVLTVLIGGPVFCFILWKRK
jgi:iron complex transport system permease protein